MTEERSIIDRKKKKLEKPVNLSKKPVNLSNDSKRFKFQRGQEKSRFGFAEFDILTIFDKWELV